MSIDSFGKLTPPKERKVDETKLEEKLAQNLAEFNAKADEDLSTPPIPKREKKASEDAEDSTPIDETQSAEKTTDTEVKTDDSEAGEEQTPTPIPDNHYRALIHQGWTAEQISKLNESDSELLLSLAKKTYEDVNNLSKTFSDLGRKRKAMEAGQVDNNQQIQQTNQTNDLDALREKYETDPFGAMVDLINMNQSKRPQRQIQQTFVQEPSEMSDLEVQQQLFAFWGDKEMEPYSEFYGPTFNENGQPYFTKDHLTPGQMANRHQMLVIAEEIMAGAELRGTPMPLQSALNMAHMAVSAPIAGRIARKSILKTAKKRADSVTLKPGVRKGTVSSKPGEAKSKEEFEQVTKERIDRFKRGEKVL